ncbi:hypothetical protein BJV82DRAFT_575694 [Fennellomyces sp. T-0311]|nr:hypothetical protein BJV82DRAFT_575694 [Fennellomyces sp. T-0311]
MAFSLLLLLPLSGPSGHRRRRHHHHRPNGRRALCTASSPYYAISMAAPPEISPTTRMTGWPLLYALRQLASLLTLWLEQIQEQSGLDIAKAPSVMVTSGMRRQRSGRTTDVLTEWIYKLTSQIQSWASASPMYQIFTYCQKHRHVTYWHKKQKKKN